MAPHAEEPNGHVNGNGHQATSTPQNDMFTVASPQVNYTDNEIQSRYTYRTTSIEKTAEGTMKASPKETLYDFKTERKVPHTGVMLVGLGGNNGTTVTAGIMANRRNLVWDTREGKRAANYYGSVIMGSTVKLGTDSSTGEEIYVPFNTLLPMVHPNDLVIGGWDISGLNMAEAMDRAQVLEPTLKAMVAKEMAQMTPLPSVYYPDFIAANQGARADNVLPGDKACWDHVEKIQKDIAYVDFSMSTRSATFS